MSITTRSEDQLWRLIAGHQPGDVLDLINWVKGYMGPDSVHALDSAVEHGMIEHDHESHYRVVLTNLPRALAQRYLNLSAAVGFLSLPEGQEEFDYQELQERIGSLLNELIKDPDYSDLIAAREKKGR